MVIRLLKQPLFMAGFCFVALLFAASCLYTVLTDDYIPQTEMLFDENYDFIAASPLPPALSPPLGTDKRGYSIGAMVLIGAKYTLGIVFVITLTRMALSAFFGWLYGMYFYQFKRAVTGLSDGMHYIPLTLLAYLVLNQVLVSSSMTGDFVYSAFDRQLFEVILLAVIGVPVASIQIGNRIGEIRCREFIDSARVLGAGRWQLFWRDIRPHLIPRFTLIFIHQLIQVMIILVHLGVLHLFFGGTVLVQGFEGIEAYSATNEWGGLLGLNNFSFMTTNTWMFYGPVIAVTLTVIAFSFMMAGMQRVIESGDQPLVKTKKSRDRVVRRERQPVSETSFHFVSHP